VSRLIKVSVRKHKNNLKLLQTFLFFEKNDKTFADLMPELGVESRYHLFENTRLKVQLSLVSAPTVFFSFE
jgi:hypothetical protein